MSEWMHYPDNCPDCGSDLEAFTDSSEEGFVFDDDPVRCVECGARGIVTIYGEDSVEIQWDESAGGE